VEQSSAMATLLAPDIGYDKSAAIVKEALSKRRTVREVAIEKSGLSRERIDQLFR
jgi:fumarate hydratase class II